MIEIEIAAIENFSAILAGVLIPLEHVVTRKFHFLLWKPIKHQEYNHPRNADLEGDRRDQFVVRRICGQIAPTLEVVSHEVIGLI